MTDKRIFFETDNVQQTLLGFRNMLDTFVPGDKFESERNSYISLIMGDMVSESAQWDQLCQINIGYIGNGFITSLTEESILSSKEKMDDVFSACYRFLFELYLSKRNNFSRDFEKARIFATESIKSFHEGAQDQIAYATQEMPISIMKKLLNDTGFETLKEFNYVSEKAIELKNEWDKSIAEKEEQVESIKNSLSKYETAFNFVGLYEGYDALCSEKQDEKETLVFWLRFLGVVAVIPIFIELFFVYLNIDQLSKIQTGLIFASIPTISLVAISIYYFRVLLINYKSVKSQLLQISLRKTLCRFIQSYADYSKDIKEKNSASLEKFEDVIFSNLVASDESIPATFDGFDQFGKMIKSIKG